MQSVWSDLTNTPYDPLEYFATAETRTTPEIHGFPSIEVRESSSGPEELRAQALTSPLTSLDHAGKDGLCSGRL